MTVVYIDSVFVLNALMDAVVLLAAAQLGGIPIKRRRYFVAAVLGGCYAVSVFLPGCEALGTVPGKLAAGILVALVAFGGERYFLRWLLLFFAVSCGLAGCVMALGMMTGGVPRERGVFYTNVDAGVLLAASAAAYGLLTLVFRASAEKHVKGLLMPVTLAWGDRRVRLTALCDTGNALRDPVTGYPVLVAESLCLRDLFPSELRWITETAALQAPVDLAGSLGVEGARFRLIPYHAVGVAGAMLLAVRTDWGEVGGKRYQRLMVALSPTGLGNGFTALWGAWEENEKYGNLQKMHSGSKGKIRNPAAENRILHMRK